MISAIEDIVSSFEKRKPTISTGEDGLEAMKVINALSKSALKNNIIIAENCGAYIMDEIYSLDIDNREDLLLVEIVMKKMRVY